MGFPPILIQNTEVTVHRYYLGTHVAETLQDGRLRLSRPSAFNDPFELGHYFTGKYQEKTMSTDLRTCARYHLEKFGENHDSLVGLYGKAYADLNPEDQFKKMESHLKKSDISPEFSPLEIQQMADKYFRIICFSKSSLPSKSEILLWSHYANKHQGFRIEFLFDEQHLLETVRYQKKRIAINLTKFEELGFGDGLKRAMITKFDCWMYEGEKRRIVLLKEPLSRISRDGEDYYWNFEPHEVKAVDIGARAQDEVSKVKEIVATKYPNSLLRQAYEHSQRFKLDYSPI